MTTVNSILTGQLQASLGPSLGGGIEVPDALLPVIELPLPLAQILPNPSAILDFSQIQQSYLWSPVVNQGASSGPTQRAILLSKGIWRISGQIMSINFAGPAASSASIKAARIALYEPTQASAADIASTPLEPSVPHIARFDLTLHLSKDFWMLAVETFVASGVGQSLGVEGAVYVERLI